MWMNGKKPFAIAAVLWLLTQSSLACKVAAPTWKKDQQGGVVLFQGKPEIHWQQQDLVVIAQVNGEVELSSSVGGASMLSKGLSVRVVSSQTSKAKVGEELVVSRFNRSGEKCEVYSMKSVTFADAPKGSKVKIISPQSAIADWQFNQRFIRIKSIE